MPRFLTDLIDLLSGRADEAKREAEDCRFDDEEGVPAVAAYYRLTDLPLEDWNAPRV